LAHGVDSAINSPITIATTQRKIAILNADYFPALDLDAGQEVAEAETMAVVVPAKVFVELCFVK
jgi:hypothetical protein